LVFRCFYHTAKANNSNPNDISCHRKFGYDFQSFSDILEHITNNIKVRMTMQENQTAAVKETTPSATAITTA
jgi:hypothetical protein